MWECAQIEVDIPIAIAGKIYSVPMFHVTVSHGFPFVRLNSFSFYVTVTFVGVRKIAFFPFFLVFDQECQYRLAQQILYLYLRLPNNQCSHCLKYLKIYL